jgi:Caspase domain
MTLRSVAHDYNTSKNGADELSMVARSEFKQNSLFCLVKCLTTACLLATSLTWLGALSPAHARRVALVIGNSKYAHVERLANPVRDAQAVGEALKRLQFDTVTILQDLGKEAMSRALQAFEDEANAADIALIFFAGHGIEVDGQNYLIPTDARLIRATAAEFEALELSKVTKRIQGAAKLRLVILDACRNNPFRPKMRADAGSQRRSIGRGLAQVDPGQNELVAFAAAAGTEADDGDAGHSPYTKALLKHLETPGLEIGQLFREVRDEVLSATNREQTPHLYGTLGRDQIYLMPTPSAVGTSTAGAPSADYERVRKRLAELEAQVQLRPPIASLAVQHPATLPETAIPRQGSAATEVSGAVEPAARTAALILPGIDSLGADKETVLPSLASGPIVALSQPEINRRLQTELKRVGCFAPSASGVWGPQSRRALGQFVRITRSALTGDEATTAVLAAALSQKERVCPLVTEAPNKAQSKRVKIAPVSAVAAKEQDAVTKPTKRAANRTVVSLGAEKREPPKLQKTAAAEPTSEKVTKRSLSVGGSQKSAKPSRPDGLRHSFTIWPAYSLPQGQTASASTPYGTLTCSGGSGSSPRTCRW